jgi:hypothetical protein
VCSAGLCFCVVNFYLCNFHGSPHLPLMSTRIRVESGILFFVIFLAILWLRPFFFGGEKRAGVPSSLAMHLIYIYVCGFQYYESLLFSYDMHVFARKKV